MPVFSYYDADTDGQVYYVLPDAGWDDVTSVAESESETISSGTTIQSEDLPGYFVMHHGRPQPAAGKVAKFYPADNDILTPAEGRQKHGLEIGTKTGTWVQSMATKFPHVQFRSVDIVPTMAHVPRPNVTFEVYDFTDGLMLEDESQDVVFINAAVELVKDYQSLLREAHRVLRPGGLLHIIEHYLRLWNPENMSELASRIAPRACHLLETVREQMPTMGLDPDSDQASWLACAGFKPMERRKGPKRRVSAD
ncbi:methyltransferase domain protein [Ceratobasidium sp. AG-Ba]|nr:methyltransferase domain protein [Ceratobasidium sp. AG-Ba]